MFFVQAIDQSAPSMHNAREVHDGNR